MKKETDISLRFGVMYPPLAEQLALQGVQCTCFSANEMEEYRNLLFRLLLEGIITDGESKKIHQRFFNQINRNLKFCEPEDRDGKN